MCNCIFLSDLKPYLFPLGRDQVYCAICFLWPGGKGKTECLKLKGIRHECQSGGRLPGQAPQIRQLRGVICRKMVLVSQTRQIMDMAYGVPARCIAWIPVSTTITAGASLTRLARILEEWQCASMHLGSAYRMVCTQRSLNR